MDLTKMSNPYEQLINTNYGLSHLQHNVKFRHLLHNWLRLYGQTQIPCMCSTSLFFSGRMNLNMFICLWKQILTNLCQLWYQHLQKKPHPLPGESGVNIAPITESVASVAFRGSDSNQRSNIWQWQLIWNINAAGDLPSIGMSITIKETCCWRSILRCTLINWPSGLVQS